jgi:hypothetical protein
VSHPILRSKVVQQINDKARMCPLQVVTFGIATSNWNHDYRIQSALFLGVSIACSSNQKAASLRKYGEVLYHVAWQFSNTRRHRFTTTIVCGCFPNPVSASQYHYHQNEPVFEPPPAPPECSAHCYFNVAAIPSSHPATTRIPVDAGEAKVQDRRASKGAVS